MRKTIACLTAMSLLVMIAPSALAVHSTNVAVLACGGYSYDGTTGSDTVGAEVNPYYRVLYLPQTAEYEEAATALNNDVQDGDTDGDNHPLEGNASAHVSVREGFEELAGAGTDDLDDSSDTECQQEF